MYIYMYIKTCVKNYIDGQYELQLQGKKWMAVTWLIQRY